jgi:hypothetical protein
MLMVDYCSSYLLASALLDDTSLVRPRPEPRSESTKRLQERARVGAFTAVRKRFSRAIVEEMEVELFLKHARNTKWDETRGTCDDTEPDEVSSTAA